MTCLGMRGWEVGRLWENTWPGLSSSHKDTHANKLGPTLLSPFDLEYQATDPLSKYSHMRTHQKNFARTQFRLKVFHSQSVHSKRYELELLGGKLKRKLSYRLLQRVPYKPEKILTSSYCSVTLEELPILRDKFLQDEFLKMVVCRIFVGWWCHL